MIPYWVYQSCFCFWQPISLSFWYNHLYQLGCLLMQLPIWYSHIIFGISVPVIYSWCPRVIGWVLTQPRILYSLDILQSSSSWDHLPLSLINHFLCLILRVQLLYSFIRYWLAQFQCVVIVSCCFFFFHHPILGGVLNFTLSMVRAFQFWSYESLNTLVCIHHLLQNYDVSLVVRFSVDVVLQKPLCFLAYGFLMLFLFHMWFRFIILVRMSPCWFVKQLLNCFIHYFLEFSYEFQSVSSSAGFWQVFLVFWLFLITFMILRWLFCHLLLSYFSSMLTWLSCHFMTLC